MVEKGFPGGWDGKESACNSGDLGSIPGEDPLEKEMATGSSILACRIPWTGKPGRLQRGDMTEQLTNTHTHTHAHTQLLKRNKKVNHLFIAHEWHEIRICILKWLYQKPAFLICLHIKSGCFCTWRQSGGVATERATKSKTFTIRHLTKKVCQPWISMSNKRKCFQV